MEEPSFLTVRQMAERNPAFTEPSLRWLIFNRKHNGFDAAFRKIGKRMLIDVPVFNARIKRGDQEG
jgi:hypothetical protein